MYHLILLCILKSWRNHKQSRNKTDFNHVYFWNLLLSGWGTLATTSGYECSLCPSLSLSLSLSHSLQATGCRFYNSFLHIQPPYLVRFLWNLLSLCHVLYWIEIYSLLMCSIWETKQEQILYLLNNEN